MLWRQSTKLTALQSKFLLLVVFLLFLTLFSFSHSQCNWFADHCDGLHFYNCIAEGGCWLAYYAAEGVLDLALLVLEGVEWIVDQILDACIGAIGLAKGLIDVAVQGIDAIVYPLL